MVTGSVLIGRTSATGVPRYETVTVWPERTRRITSENRALASYVEYVTILRV